MTLPFRFPFRGHDAHTGREELPDVLHEQLRQRAQRNHRSVTKEAIVLLEQGILGTEAPKRQPIQLPPPIKLKGGPLTIEWIEAAIAEGRD